MVRMRLMVISQNIHFYLHSDDMGILILVIALINILPLIKNGEECKTDKSVDKCYLNEHLNNILPDISLNNIVRDRDFILCSYGHNGLMWSIIVKEDGGFLEYHGNTREDIVESYDNTETNINEIIMQNKELIQWGLDSLPLESKRIIPNVNNNYNPVYCNIRVYNKNGECVFADTNSESYDGVGDIQFKRNFKKLKFLMIWLNSPNLHQYLPDPSDEAYKDTH